MAEAEKKAAKEQALREKHEARVIEVQQELQEAAKKCETLEQSLTGKNPNSPRLVKPHTMPGAKPKAPYRKSRRPERSRRVRLFLCKANI